MTSISALYGHRSTICHHRRDVDVVDVVFSHILLTGYVFAHLRDGRPSPPGDRGMDPLKASIGLQKLIFRHYPTLLEYKADGAVLIRMDEHGNVVDFAETSPTDGGNSPPEPKPGQGYYAHIQLTGIVVGAAVGGEK